MGSTPGLFVDPAAIRNAARTFETTAATVADVARLQPGFGAAVAGRGYAADGAVLREALDALASDLRGWARSSAEIAAELLVSAERYIEAERAAVAGLG